MIEVLHSVSVMNRAGQETLLMNILRNINRQQIHFSFLCSLPNKGDYDDEIETLGGKIFHLPSNYLQKIKYLNYLGDIYAYFHFFKKHPELQIFHIHNYHAFTTYIQVVGAKLAGVHSIIVHSHNSSAPHKRLHYLFRKLLLICNIERLACSDVAGKWMFGLNKSYEIINNGIILNSFLYSGDKRKNLRQEWGISDQEYVIGHIGRFNYQKNHSFLLKIFKEIKKLNEHSHLFLVGTGELEEDIKLEVEHLGLNNSVHFLGVKSNVPDLLSAFDLFLFPSLFEGLSVVLIEAQANGLPCLISDTNSSEVMLTPNIQMASLNEPPMDWAKKAILCIRKLKRLNNIDLLRKKGYDINATTDYLSSKYEHLK